MKNQLKQPLTGKQTLAALGGLIAAAGLLYGLYALAQEGWHRHVMHQTIPIVLAELRAQRGSVIQAIDAYRKQFGFFPPASLTKEGSRGVINPLFYELIGTRHDETTNKFYVPNDKEPIHSEEMARLFNTRCFRNTIQYPNWPTNFLADRPLGKTELAPEIDASGIGFLDICIPFLVSEDFHLSAWRYVIDAPEHNPGKYDLWIEMEVAGKHYLIGNWPAVE